MQLWFFWIRHVILLCTLGWPTSLSAFLFYSGFPHGEMLSSKEHLTLPGDIFDYQLGGWCYRHVVGRGQGCFWTSYNTLESSLQQRITLPRMSINAEVEKPCSVRITEKLSNTYGTVLSFGFCLVQTDNCHFNSPVVF